MIDWLFPVKCPVCSGVVLPRKTLIHKECMEQLPFLTEPLCNRCGRPLCEDTAEYCEACEKEMQKGKRSVPWDSGRYVFFYRGEVIPALRKLKNEGTKEVVTFFGHQMAERHAVYLSHLNPECLVPVPMYPFKKRQRGFNQAELLATAVSEEFPERKVPVVPLLKKAKKTVDQKSLSGAERKRNLAHAFCFEKAYRERVPHTVLLIDDVFTTGSTIAACATVLKEQGVKQIGFLCACLSEGGQ